MTSGVIGLYFGPIAFNMAILVSSLVVLVYQFAALWRMRNR
jgi:hypothetical protein